MSTLFRTASVTLQSARPAGSVPPGSDTRTRPDRTCLGSGLWKELGLSKLPPGVEEFF